MTGWRKDEDIKPPEFRLSNQNHTHPQRPIFLIVITVFTVPISILFIANSHSSQSSIMPSSSSMTSTPTNNMGGTGPRCTVEGCVREAVTGTQLCVIREPMALADHYAPAY